MAGSSPEEAVDNFIGPLRQALACVVRATAIGSGHRQDEPNSVTLFPEGQDGGDPARVRTHGGEGELLLRFAHLYRVVHVPGDQQCGPYKVSSSFYRYDILDRDEDEVVVFHWEPEGRSPVRTPHLHLPAATPIVLPQRGGSGVAGAKTHLGKLHLPTGRILIEDVVELLIREFGAVPLNENWAAILEKNREAFARGRRW